MYTKLQGIYSTFHSSSPVVPSSPDSCQYNLLCDGLYVLVGIHGYTVSHCHTNLQERGCGYHGYCLNFGFAVCLYSTADKPKLYQLQCLQSQQRRVKITQTVAAKWEDIALGSAAL